tara:strand:+ start:452 stop:643 length:192 start_codon:yes stop_codon:yes gene_type:complete
LANYGREHKSGFKNLDRVNPGREINDFKDVGGRLINDGDEYMKADNTRFEPQRTMIRSLDELY